MLQELYQYALSRKLSARPGFKAKSVKVYILLGVDGTFLGFDPALDKKTVCPDIGSAAQGTTKCNILTEKADIVLLLEDKQTVKHQFFTDALRSGQEAEPLFGVCLHALEDAETLAQMRKVFAESKYKPGDVIGFKVDGFKVERSEAYLNWWEMFRAEQTAEKSMKGKTDGGLPRCLITGEPTKPLQTVPKVGGLRSVGGHSSGDALLCFDKQAFCSYDLRQGNNAAVSESAMTAVNTALNDLIEVAPVLCGAKYVHWYQKPIEQEYDLFTGMFAGMGDEKSVSGEEAETEADSAIVPVAGAQTSVSSASIVAQSEEPRALRAARRLIESVKNGENPEKLQNQYYMLTLSGAGGRVMIRSFIQGSYKELYESVNAWFEDLRLVSPSGSGRSKPPKLFALHIRLLKNENSSKSLLKRMGEELAGVEPRVWFSIVKNQVLPDTVAVRALAYIRSKMLASSDDNGKREPVPDTVACQWLKVWLVRRQKKGGNVTMQETLNKQNPSAAYQAGRMMAVFAAIQREALGPNLGAGVIQRYYASASTTPALVIGTLARMSQYHLSKIENKRYAARYEKLLGEIAQAVAQGKENRFPATLSLEQQADFALGYYQQRADLYTSHKDGSTAGQGENDTPAAKQEEE